MVTGGFRTKAGMRDAVESGATDVVGLARPLAAEPDLPKRLMSGEADAALPVRLDTGIKLIDKVVQGSWYQLQLDRMGRGKPADPELSRLRAFVGYVMPRRNLTPVDEVTLRRRSSGATREPLSA